MRRLAVILALATAFVDVPFTLWAQQSGKVPRIGFISTTSPGTSPATEAFVQALRDLGYVEGQNITVEWRWGRGKTERFPEFAADLVRLKVDAIVAANPPAGHAAQAATRTIPIVIPTMNDAVGDGFVASLGRPGGNITGLSVHGREIQGKQLQLLKEALPNLSPIALLVDAADRTNPDVVREAESAARVLGVRFHPLVEARGPGDLAGAFARITKDGARAALVVGGTMFYANRVQLAEHALKSRLPMMCRNREYVVAGCLMAYGYSLPDLFRRAATYVDKILKGAKPGDLPVEQPTKFELVINLKTAKALGLTIPQSLLLRADQIIE
jgi:putative tryptophan/tyrosine transport system substrate-binding protein